MKLSRKLNLLLEDVEKRFSKLMILATNIMDIESKDIANYVKVSKLPTNIKSDISVINGIIRKIKSALNKPNKAGKGPTPVGAALKLFKELASEVSSINRLIAKSKLPNDDAVKLEKYTRTLANQMVDLKDALKSKSV